MGLADRFKRLNRSLVNQFGTTAVLDRTGPDDPGEEIKLQRTEKPVRMPWRYRKDVEDLPDAEQCFFRLPIPDPLPAPFTDAREWAEAKLGRGRFFTMSGIRYNVYRLIPEDPQDVLVGFILVCNN